MQSNGYLKSTGKQRLPEINQKSSKWLPEISQVGISKPL
jgi:hypothetical protein